MSIIACPIVSLEYLNHDTRRVILETGSGMDFKAGQYLEVVAGDKRYPFSIASPPSLKGRVELHVRPTQDSSDSDAFEKLLDESTSLTIDLPKGDCFLETAPNKPLLLIAASTGVTQMKSIIEHLLPGGLSHPLYLYWGVVSEQDLYFTGMCETWSASDSNFHYVPVVSEPESSPDWQGKIGLVGEAAIADFGSLAPFHTLIGGSPGMVYGTLDMLVAAGLQESNAQSDVFSYAPRH